MTHCHFVTVVALALSGVSRSASAAPLSKSAEAVRDISETAEDIGDNAAKGRWDRSAEAAKKARAELAAIPGLPASGVAGVTKALDAADAAIAAKQVASTQEASDEVGLAVADLLKPLAGNEIADITRLDPLTRQLARAANAKDAATAAKVEDSLKSTWADLRPAVVRKKAGLAEEWDHDVAAQDKAIAAGDFPALHRAANDAGELVDSLESLYGIGD